MDLFRNRRFLNQLILGPVLDMVIQQFGPLLFIHDIADYLLVLFPTFFSVNFGHLCEELLNEGRLADELLFLCNIFIFIGLKCMF